MMIACRSLALVAPLVLLGSAGCDASPRAADRPFAESTTQPAGEPLVLQGRVNDAAGILSAAVEERLTRKLAALEVRTKHQLVVATTPSLSGKEIAEYSLETARRWGIGRKRYNDGVVLLVAPNDRKVRIEVGYGLEKTLTNPESQRIIDEAMLPDFREGRLAQGIEAGTDVLIAKLR